MGFYCIPGGFFEGGGLSVLKGGECLPDSLRYRDRFAGISNMIGHVFPAQSGAAPEEAGY
jgi:hypothetical protein